MIAYNWQKRREFCFSEGNIEGIDKTWYLVGWLRWGNGENTDSGRKMHICQWNQSCASYFSARIAAIHSILWIHIAYTYSDNMLETDFVFFTYYAWYIMFIVIPSSTFLFWSWLSRKVTSRDVGGIWTSPTLRTYTQALANIRMFTQGESEITVNPSFAFQGQCHDMF